MRQSRKRRHSKKNKYVLKHLKDILCCAYYLLEIIDRIIGWFDR